MLLSLLLFAAAVQFLKANFQEDFFFIYVTARSGIGLYLFVFISFTVQMNWVE